MICVVYRGFGGISGIGDNSGATKAAATTANIPARTLQDTTGGSWVVAFAGSKQASTQGTPLAGATQSRGTQTGTTFDIGAFDTNGGVSSFSATTSSNNTSVTSSGVSIEILPVGSVSAASLTDDFNDNSLDGSKWDSGTNGAGSTFAESSQQINETPAASVADAESYMVGTAFDPKYDLTGSAFFVNLKQALNASADAYTYLWALADDNNNFRMQVNGATRTLAFIKIVAGAEATVASATYNSTTHAWVRIRESAGTTYGDYSSDGSSWTNLGSVANPFAITRVYPKLNAYAGIVATPGAAIWDSFNTAPAANITVTPGVATLTLATFAPKALAPRVVIPGVASLTTTKYAPVIASKIIIPKLSLTLTTFAPTVLTPRVAIPGIKALTITSFAPTVLAPRVVIPSTASLTTTKFAPVIALAVIPSKKALTLTTYAPIIQPSPSTASLAITTYAPTIKLGKVSTPSTAALTIATYAPTVLTPRVVIPGTLALITTKYAPIIARVLIPSTKALTLTTFAPTVLAPRVVIPSTLALTATKYAPTVLVPGAVVPSTKALTLTTYAPTVLAPRVVIPGKLSLTLTGFAPNVLVPRVVIPATATLSLTEYSPMVLATAEAIFTPGTGLLIITTYIPDVVIPIRRFKHMNDHFPVNVSSRYLRRNTPGWN